MHHDQGRDRTHREVITSSFGCMLFLLSLGASAQHDADELAKKLSNPVAALISVPLQLNWDTNMGPEEEGDRFTLNIQPVIPIPLSEDWNMISRTILPIIDQSDIFPGAGSQSGTGDTVQSLFFSPKHPTASGWIWGAGPVFLLPTASDDLLGQREMGVRPDSRGAEAGRTLDLWCTPQPHRICGRR